MPLDYTFPILCNAGRSVLAQTPLRRFVVDFKFLDKSYNKMLRISCKLSTWHDLLHNLC